jgi:hypothetical protein
MGSKTRCRVGVGVVSPVKFTTLVLRLSCLDAVKRKVAKMIRKALEQVGCRGLVSVLGGVSIAVVYQLMTASLSV